MMFGGWNWWNLLARIAAYTPNTDERTTEGNLLTPRKRAGVITVDDNLFLIIGGFMKSNDQIRSEKCEFDGSQLKCAYQNPILRSGKL